MEIFKKLAAFFRRPATGDASQTGIISEPMAPIDFPIPDRVPRQFSTDEPLPFVKAPEGEHPVFLAGLEINVTVSGLLAETTQTMRFTNPNNRVLEGELLFPLPDGAVVCGYALDVNGVMVDGVVVPKQEARRILEAEIRKGIDPGLVEHVQGNLYRTRLYPLPARGTRTVRITYVSPLTVSGIDAAYHLPLRHAHLIESVALHLEVIQAPVEPQISGGLGNITLNRWNNAWVANATLGKGVRAEDLQIRLPALPAEFSSVEKTAHGETFFCVSRHYGETNRGSWNPRRLAVAWDSSGSRSSMEREVEFLKGLLAACPDLVMDFQIFRDRVESQTRTFSAGEASTLAGWLDGLPRDGGTDLSALDLSRTPHEEDEAWLLFTDGLGTLGKQVPTLGKKPVVTISSQVRCNGALLDHLASQTRGLHLDLIRIPVREAISRLRRLGSFPHISEAVGCADLHVSATDGRLTVLGRLTGPEATFRVADSNGAGEPVVINPGLAVPGRLLARAWAGWEAQKISLLEDGNTDKLATLGRTYGLVTPGTSLLVLERLEQYLEYRIEPPASLPEMVSQYRSRIEALEKQKKDATTKQIEYVLGLWNKRIAWWEKEYQPPPLKALVPDPNEPDSPAPDASMMRPAAFASRSRSSRTGDMPEASARDDSPIRRSVMRRSSAPSGSPVQDPPMLAPSGPTSDDQVLACCRAPEGSAPVSAGAGIAIQPWQPDVPYLPALRNAPSEQAYDAYLGQKAAYVASPSFYFDCSDFFFQKGEKEIGKRILSNLLEIGLDEPSLLRICAWRLQQAGELDLAIDLLERVLRQRSDEPQSHRDLGLALGLRWEISANETDLTRAINLLYEVILKKWDRFPEIEVIALMELNRLIHLARKRGLAIPDHIDSRLQRHLDLDLRISLSWDADLTDVDLHVFDPLGEHAYYGHNLTAIGGLVSRDFTRGYGPEEFVLRKAVSGEYQIKAHYFGSSQATLVGPCTVMATVFTNYGRDDEKKEVMMLRLDKPHNDVVVGKVTIAPDAVRLSGVPTGSNLQGSSPTPPWETAFRGLRRGMTVDEIVQAVGQPAALQGTQEPILIYRPAPGVNIQVRIGPNLLAVQQIFEGGVLDLV